MEEDWASRIRLLILDVDGVMTDGRILLNAHGEEIKCFHVKDGYGIRTLLRAGVDVAIVSGRQSRAVTHRARELGIREIHLGVKDKDALCRELLGRKKLERNQVCCVGDDLPDLAMFEYAGVAFAVADAAPEVRDAADYTTRTRGGQGAVREVCELILKSRQRRPGSARTSPAP